MIWLQFALSAVAITVTGVKLAEYGDAIAYRTKLGGLFIGTLLMAGATSLPEILTMTSALQQNHLNLTAGDLFGSCMFNMLLLAVLDLLFHSTRMLRRVALNHALTASLGTLLIGMAVFFILADIDVSIGWLGIGGLAIMGVYAASVWLLRNNPTTAPLSESVVGIDDHIPSLRRASIGFAIAAAVLVAVTPWLVSSAAEIAEITGLGDGFVGIVLIALVTSLPELVAGIAAVRVGAYDLAVGNLFGSNMFNMFTLGLADVVYTRGNFLDAIDPAFAIAGLLAMMLTALGLVGNLAQVERRVLIVEMDALLLILVYLGGLWLLYSRGVGIG